MRELINPLLRPEFIPTEGVPSKKELRQWQDLGYEWCEHHERLELLTSEERDQFNAMKTSKTFVMASSRYTPKATK